MVYARCRYLVMMQADECQRTMYCIKRGRLFELLRQVCKLLSCELEQAHISSGYVTMLIGLNVNISIKEFLERLQTWTSSWIVGTERDYWAKVCCLPISPEDNTVNLAIHGDINKTEKILHHIILVTSRNRLLIPLKYHGLMSQMVTEVASSLRADVVACSAMRNHLHLLSKVPSYISITQFIDKLKDSLQQNMLANCHLRRVEGWSEHSIVFTVTTDRINEEEHTIADQNHIHRHSTINEMSPLHNRLNIPFIASLH